MKLARRLIRLALALAVLIVALGVVALFLLGPLVKTAVNTVGPKLLGVPVSVQDVAIHPLGGSIRLSDVLIGNPKGYSDDPLFSLKEVRVGVDMKSLPGSGPVVIRELAIIEPQVAYEVAGGKSNLEALTAALPRPDKSREKKRKQAKEPRKVIIDRLEFLDGQVTYRAKMTLGKAVPLPLPDVRLTGIGRDQGGIAFADAMIKILGELINQVGTVIAKVGTAVVETGAAAAQTGKDAVKAVGSAAKGLLKSVTGDN